MEHFEARWSSALVFSSALVTLVCLGVTALLSTSGVAEIRAVALLPVLVLVLAALFTVRGYTIGADAIRVRRLLWSTRLPVAGLRGARHEPDVMRGSLRTFGNGGLYSFSGWFRNARLGVYRAFVTDPHRTVVLEYAGRPVVVSPARPGAFVDALPVAGDERPAEEAGH